MEETNQLEPKLNAFLDEDDEEEDVMSEEDDDGEIEKWVVVRLRGGCGERWWVMLNKLIIYKFTISFKTLKTLSNTTDQPKKGIDH